MNTIIRIEHEDGFGICRYQLNPFKQRYVIGDSAETDDLWSRHNDIPPPARDNLASVMTDQHYCAFKSLESFENMVYRHEVNFLLKMNFKVYLLEVSECFFGNYQCIYRKQDILLKKDISNLFL